MLLLLIIPNDIIEPKLAPKIIDNCSNLANPFSPKPYNGITDNIKNATRTIRHFSFSLNYVFCSGVFTCGKNDKILVSRDIFLI